MQCPSCHSVIDDGSPRFCPSCGAPLPQASAPDAHGADPLVGQVLGGKYRVVRLLGEGGMGAVYEGEQQLGTSKRKVAVKTLHPHLSRNPQVEARFQREVGTIAELEHPHTIQVYDFGSTPEGILYIVMEFLSGKSIADLLVAQGAMAPDRVARILDQVCGSLAEAHARGIVHRDLKPDNVVLVERAGQKDFVKVLDFGIAKRAGEEDRNEKKLTEQGTVLGTPQYMSPEQFTGQPVDARSDIYSLGVMAYEMLSGQLPFRASTAWEWATQHMTKPPIPIESLAEGGRVPIAMRSALATALAKSPDERFQTVMQFCEAFEGKVAPATSTRRALPGLRTELGAPLDAAPAAQPPYTPAAGSMAFPTPAGIPPAPAEPERPRSRGLLLGAAVLIAVASVVAILFALRGSRGNNEVVFDNAPSAAPATSLAPAAVTDTVSPPGPASAIPALLGGGQGAAAKHTGPHPGPGTIASSAHAEPSTHPEPSARTEPSAVASSAAAVPTASAPPSTVSPGARYDGIECQRARQFKAAGRPREAQAWGLACIAKGGAP